MLNWRSFVRTSLQRLVLSSLKAGSCPASSSVVSSVTFSLTAALSLCICCGLSFYLPLLCHQHAQTKRRGSVVDCQGQIYFHTAKKSPAQCTQETQRNQAKQEKMETLRAVKCGDAPSSMDKQDHNRVGESSADGWAGWVMREEERLWECHWGDVGGMWVDRNLVRRAEIILHYWWKGSVAFEVKRASAGWRVHLGLGVNVKVFMRTSEGGKALQQYSWGWRKRAETSVLTLTAATVSNQLTQSSRVFY